MDAYSKWDPKDDWVEVEGVSGVLVCVNAEQLSAVFLFTQKQVVSVNKVALHWTCHLKVLRKVQCVHCSKCCGYKWLKQLMALTSPVNNTIFST